jgi:hypothetical protein
MIESKLEELDPIAPRGAHDADARMVRSIGKIKLPRAIHRPSLAGTGLPERMRTAAFAFLGLTAASGLALVAIFAQINFHVLSPVPLPGEPGGGGVVAEAVALDHGSGTFVPAVSRRVEASDRSLAGGPGSGAAGAAALGGGLAPTGAPGPAPPGPSGGGIVTEPTDHPAPNPASAPGAGPGSGQADTPTAAGEAAPNTSPQPAPVPARPASPTPATAPAPGNSSSSAAAAHASERGIEASSKSSASVEVPVSTASTSPPPSADADPGNGKALGHTK